MKRRTLLALSVSAGAALGGCIGSGPSDDGPPTVDVTERWYEPDSLSVDVGTEVTWVNRDSTILPRHTVTSTKLVDGAEEWEFHEVLEEEGDEASHTFESEGLYGYYCDVEGERCMCGLVEVGDVSYDEFLPCHPGKGGGC